MTSLKAAGIQATLRVIVTAGVAVASLTEAVSYDIPNLVNINIANMRPVGADSLTMSGSSFGPVGYTMQGHIGDSACEMTAWVSDTALYVKVAAGVHRTLTVTVTAGIRVGTSTEAVTYDAVILSSVALTNMVTTGGEVVTVTGTNFGKSDYTGMARIGNSAGEMTQWTSDTSVVVKSAAGISRTLTITATAGVIVGTLTEAISYNIPMVVSMVGNVRTAGQSSVTVSGGFFAQTDYTMASTFGGTACEATVWVSETTVVVKHPSGVSRTQIVTVTSGVMVGTVTEAVSYDAPSVHVIDVAVAKTVGTDSLTMTGSQFGMTDYSLQFRIGHTACEATNWKSETSVGVKISAGIGATHRVTITAGVVVGTLTEAVSYKIPVLSSTSQTNFVSIGLQVLHISGTHFGQDTYSQADRMGNTAAESSLWVSDTSVLLKVARGYAHGHSLTLTAGIRVGTLSKAASYDIPKVS